MALLSLYVVWYVVSMVFPQRGLEPDAEIAAWIELTGRLGSFAEWAGLVDLKRSWLLFTTHQLLFINLVVCMLQRVRPMWMASQRPRHVPVRGAFRLDRDLSAPGLTLERAQHVLRRRGFALTTDGTAVYGLRGRFAYVGHFIFHIGFVVLLVVAARIGFLPDPFTGMVGVGEGEPFSLHESQLLGSSRPVNDSLPPLAFQLQNAIVETVETDLTQFDAVISTESGTETVRINDPYRHGPYQVIPEGFGFMPGWVLIHRGQMVAGAWLKLVPFPYEYRETIALGEDGWIELVFLPHRVEDGDLSTNASNALDNPYFLVTATWKGEQVYNDWLAPGQPMELEPGLTFNFTPEIRRWVIFRVIEEQGHWGVFASFGVILLGLVLRYARIRKEVRVELLDDGRVDLRGDTEILESLFEEELDALAAELAAAGGGEVVAGDAG